MRSFNKVMVVALVAFGAAACEKSTPDQGQTSTASPAISVAKVDVAKASDFPAGFTPSFGYRIRSKRIDTVDGQQYKKLVIEFKGGEAADIDRSVQTGLEQLNYRRYKTIRQDNGAIIGDYGRNGHRITATTTPLQPDMSLFDPEAKGTVYFVWKP